MQERALTSFALKGGPKIGTISVGLNFIKYWPIFIILFTYSYAVSSDVITDVIAIWCFSKVLFVYKEFGNYVIPSWTLNIWRKNSRIWQFSLL